MPDAQNLDANAFAEQDAVLREQFRPPLDGVTSLLLKRQDLHARALAALLSRQDTEVGELRRRLEATEATLRNNAPVLRAARMHVPLGASASHAGGAGALGGGGST